MGIYLLIFSMKSEWRRIEKSSTSKWHTSVICSCLFFTLFPSLFIHIYCHCSWVSMNQRYTCMLLPHNWPNNVYMFSTKSPSGSLSHIHSCPCRNNHTMSFTQLVVPKYYTICVFIWTLQCFYYKNNTEHVLCLNFLV